MEHTSMNRRLKELAADAGYPDYMTYGQDKVLERFAELIVQECLHIVDDEGCGEGGSVRAIEKIKQHFGVEL